MKKALLMVLCLFFINSTSMNLYGEQIEWLTSYEDAVTKAKDENKPIVLFFTGSDWCSWCHKLENEALDTPEFAESAGDSFIFVMLDFPMRTKQDPTLIDQNKELQEKYEVRSFPTVILLDSDEHQIGVTGYRSGGGKQYAEHLKGMAKDYLSYQETFQKVGKGVLSGSALKALYRQAKEFHRIGDQIKISKEGVNSDRSHFFMIERYRFLAEEGQIHNKEAVALKERLQKSDPDNHYLTHYQLACIDFHAYADEMDREGYSPDLAVVPFTNYIKQFGAKDHENSWRINMIISQVYSDSKLPQKALYYAQCAYDCAPEETKEEIAMVINTFETP